MATTNIVNSQTGQAGYQVPGAAPPPGWVSTTQTAPSSGGIVAPTGGPVSTTVPATGLQNPQAPLVLPPPNNNSVADNINAQSGALSELIKTQQATQDAAQSKADSSTKSLQDVLAEKLGIQSSKGKLEADAGIPGFIETARKAGNDLQVSQRAQLNELRALDKSGLSDAERNIKAKEINKQYAFEQADLSLTYHLANSDYTAAQATVDKKIELELEPLNTKLEFLKYFDQQAQDNWTKQEQRQFDLQKSKVQMEIDTKQQNLKDIYSIQIEASKNGVKIPPDVMAQLNKGDITGSQALGILASKGIVLQDQLDRQYKQAQINNIYSEISNRKAMTALASSQLPGPIQTKVQSVAAQFDGEQAVKNYQTIAETVHAVKNAGVSPTDDIQRIYAVAKVLDPNSAVREGEYKTVQQYSTSLLQRAGLKANRVFNNDGFLTDEAREFIYTTLGNRLASSEKAYSNIYESYGSRINKVTGKGDGKEYITDYSAAFKTSPQTPGPVQPKDGDTKVYNGVTYKVVGGNWVAQ